jgi:hypothetical protein
MGLDKDRDDLSTSLGKALTHIAFARLRAADQWDAQRGQRGHDLRAAIVLRLERLERDLITVCETVSQHAGPRCTHAVVRLGDARDERLVCDLTEGHEGQHTHFAGMAQTCWDDADGEGGG